MIYKGLSLFANVGIAETYLDNVGLEVVLANELLEQRASFYKALHGKEVIAGDITNEAIYHNIVSRAKELGVNFILATPPCQGMSTAGAMDINDSRNTLIVKAMAALHDLRPEFMLVENVPQMFKTAIVLKEGAKPILIKDYIERCVLPLGYEVKFNVFDAADYGTAQSRKRSFTRIYKKGYVWHDPIKRQKITVREVIGNLPSLEAGESSSIAWHNARAHNERHILWMKHTPTGKSAFENPQYFPEKDGRRIKGFANTYKRMCWDKPCPTITMANGVISSQENVHPGRLLQDGTYSDARVLTLLEIFLLTGLPPNWSPPAWAHEGLIRKVIGEAIPPRLVEEIFRGLVPPPKG